MSDHLKRLNAPDSWHIAKKTTKFITKTAPGPAQCKCDADCRLAP